MFRFLLNFIGFLLSFVFTEKIMHEVWHLRNVIYSSIVRCHFKSIGKGGRFCYPLILNGGKNILIGDKFSLRERGRIEAIDFFISDHSHGKLNKTDIKKVAIERRLYSKGNIIIEDNVWIGEGCVILPNVKIGQNSVIGANTVVTKDVPRNSIVVGNPGRVIRQIE